jgi:ABC-type transport system involved in cytochrome c biogenesis ATPase subunit
MTWRDNWEHFKEEFTHREDLKMMQTDEEKAKRERRDRALHEVDLSTGSETLDD